MCSVEVREWALTQDKRHAQPIVGHFSTSSLTAVLMSDWLRQKSWSPGSISCVAARTIVRRQSWDSSAI